MSGGLEALVDLQRWRVLPWEEIFGNENPVELDVGCGRGRFMIEAAQALPDRNFIGIDVSYKSLRLARERIEKRGLPNAKAACIDADSFLRDRAAPGCFAAAYVLFPDPWPKTRHHKRRVVSPAFASALRRALAEDGSLDVATDLADYFDEMLECLESSGCFEAVWEGPYDPSSFFASNYAAKYLEQGRAMHHARLRRL